MRTPAMLAALVWLTPSIACAGSRSGPYSLEVIDQDGGRLPTYLHGGRTYVLGREGQRYSLRIRNRSASRVEFVASVDGRDVLEGTPANWSKRGYVVNAWDQVVIEGFRLTHDSVAAFRFSSVRGSYAAQTGDARDVGIIGVAVFTERMRSGNPEPALAPTERFPADPVPSAPGLGGLGTALNDALAEREGGAGSALGVGGLGTHAEGSRASSNLGSYANIDLSARPEAAPSRKATPSVAELEERPGLGTEFGEKRESHVNDVDFDRASYSPAARLTIRYDDREGLRAQGVDLVPDRTQREADRRENAQPFRESFCTPPPGWEGSAPPEDR